ncbi:hypothetical protein BH11CYA1_BH11CYA1_35950 [soil metagenome]
MLLNWLGLEIDGHKIESIVGEGPFSTVYKAVPINPGRPVVLKVAKGEIEESFEGQTGFVASTATAPASSGMGAILPEPSHLLRLQFDCLTAHTHARLIKPLSLQAIDDIVYMVLPYFAGPNLRQLLLSGQYQQATEQFLILLEALSELSENSFVHGDIKPENVICTDNGPVLIDPGYFGPILIQGLRIKNCCISTAQYYPLHDANDLLALGLMAWEVFAHYQPLRLGGDDKSAAGPILLDRIVELERSYNYDYSAIVNAALHPSRAKLSDHQARVLLQAIGLKVDGVNSKNIEPSAPFASVSELLKAIREAFAV